MDLSRLKPKTASRSRTSARTLSKWRKRSASAKTCSVAAIASTNLPEMRNEPLVKDVSSELPEVEKLVSFPAGKAPTTDEVKKVNEAVGKIMTQIQTKDSK